MTQNLIEKRQKLIDSVERMDSDDAETNLALSNPINYTSLLFRMIKESWFKAVMFIVGQFAFWFVILLFFPKGRDLIQELPYLLNQPKNMFVVLIDICILGFFTFYFLLRLVGWHSKHEMKQDEREIWKLENEIKSNGGNIVTSYESVFKRRHRANLIGATIIMSLLFISYLALREMLLTFGRIQDFFSGWF